MDRETGPVRTHPVLEPHVEHPLAPLELRVVGQGRAGEEGDRVVVAPKGSVGGQRDSYGHDLGIAKAGVVFVKLDGVGDPQPRRVPERGVGSSDVQAARFTPRIAHVAHGAEGYPHEKTEPHTFGPQEGSNRDVGRDVVSGRKPGRAQEAREERGAEARLHDSAATCPHRVHVYWRLPDGRRKPTHLA